MNFIFIVQGEGRGHMSQSVALAEMLNSANHHVQKVLIGVSPRRNIPEDFYKTFKGKVILFESPNFLIDKHEKKLRILASFFYNIVRIPIYIKSIIQIKRICDHEKPDAVINFYDMLGGLANVVMNKPFLSISIAHQYYFLHPSFKHPGELNLQRFFLWLHTRMTALGADKMLALSYREEISLPGKKLFIVPPLIRRFIKDLSPGDKGYLLGYILNPGYYHEILSWHKDHPDTEIHIFWDKKDYLPEKHKNIHFHQIDYHAFISYFKDCSAYISTAGFESIVEALFLGKPVMVRPNQNHYEQECNAKDAMESGAGIVSKQFNLSAVLENTTDLNHHRESFKDWVNQADHIFLKHLTDSMENGQ